MATTLAEIRARLKAQENKTSATNATFDNGIYPHWNIDEGKAAHEIAMQKFQEGNANEATVNIRAAHQRVKEAHRLLKDVVRKIRKANQGQDVQEGLEPESQAEDLLP